MTVPVGRVDKLGHFRMPEPSAKTDVGGPVHRLNLNESPFHPAPSVIHAMATAAAQSNLYPDGESQILLERLCKQLNYPIEKIFVGAGSNELLRASSEIALDPGDEMIAPVPAFPTYQKLATLRDADFVGIACTDDGRLDIDAMLAAVTSRTRLMFVSSPHNPTGAVMSQGELKHLSVSLPEHVMLHYDEAYFEFGRAVGAPDALQILPARSGPWVSTRTFSKAYAMAGARVGYGVAGSEKLAVAIRKVRDNFSLNRMALAGAIAALEDQRFVTELVGFIRAEQQRIAAALTPFGFRILDGASNFLAIETPEPAVQLIQTLQRQGILVQSFPMNGRDYLRATIGGTESNDAMVSALIESV